MRGEEAVRSMMKRQTKRWHRGWATVSVHRIMGQEGGGGHQGAVWARLLSRAAAAGRAAACGATALFAGGLAPPAHHYVVAAGCVP